MANKPAREDFARSQAPTVLRPRTGQSGFIIVHFPPQHIGERAFYEVEPPGSSSTPADGPTIAPGSASEPLRFTSRASSLCKLYSPRLRCAGRLPSDRVQYRGPTRRLEPSPLAHRVECICSGSAWLARAESGDLVGNLLTDVLSAPDPIKTAQTVQALSAVNAFLLGGSTATETVGRQVAVGRLAQSDIARFPGFAQSIEAVLDRLRILPFPVSPALTSPRSRLPSA